MLNLLERLLLNTMKRNKNTEKNYILITGADSGIGKQFAIQYSNIGYKIILTARNLEKLKAVQAELKTESVIIIKDLSIMDNCYELLKEVEQYKIDMFINNAGFGDFGLIEETNTEKALNEQREKKNQIISEYAKDNKIVHQLIDLALLQNGMLKGSSLDAFIKRSVSLIK